MNLHLDSPISRFDRIGIVLRFLYDGNRLLHDGVELYVDSNGVLNAVKLEKTLTSAMFLQSKFSNVTDITYNAFVAWIDSLPFTLLYEILKINAKV
jgi:hypothetical protein